MRWSRIAAGCAYTNTSWREPVSNRKWEHQTIQAQSQAFQGGGGREWTSVNLIIVPICNACVLAEVCPQSPAVRENQGAQITWSSLWELIKPCPLGVLRQVCTGATTGDQTDPFKAWAMVQSSGGFCRCSGRAAVPPHHHRLLFFLSVQNPFSFQTAQQTSCLSSVPPNKAALSPLHLTRQRRWLTRTFADMFYFYF